MRTFFIAFILGVFAGALVTAYVNKPDAFDELIEAKTRLSQPPTLQEPAALTPEPEPDPTPVSPASPPPEPVPQPIPETVPDSEPGPEEPLTPSDVPPPPAPAPLPIPKPEPDPLPDPEPTEPEWDPELDPELDPEGEAEPEAAETPESQTAPADPAPTAPQPPANAFEQASPNELRQSADATIASTIRAQFKLERDHALDAVSIEVRNREVILLGVVSESKVKQRAIEIAINTKGVSQVTAVDLRVE